MDHLDTLVSIATDLTSALTAEERYRRLLESLKRVIPYDASSLLRMEEGTLVPIVCAGMSSDVMGRRFDVREHPRLEIVCRSLSPVIFPSHSELPDPFDGLLRIEEGEFAKVHACLGCPLRVGEELVGVLTADAVEPNAFDGIDPRFLEAVEAIAAAEMRTSLMLEALEESARRQNLITKDLMRDAQQRRGVQLLGTTPVMERLRRDIELVAPADLSVLVTGETGVGKELVARGVHDGSSRRDEPMLYVNCAALPETIADSELFGHVRGAFTGATAHRAGKFEVADGGTLFLDEIGELPLSVQPKLLRALQQGEIQRIGSDAHINVDVRVVAATNRDLEQEVGSGRFRSDLFHRLNVYPLPVPSLRERAADIPLLAGHFCDIARRRLGIGPVRLTPGALEALKSYHWPGNVRELENVLSRVILRAAAGVARGAAVVLSPEHLGPEFDGPNKGTDVTMSIPAAAAMTTLGLKDSTREFQRGLILRRLAEHDGNWSATARSLGMHRSNLHHLAVRLGLK